MDSLVRMGGIKYENVPIIVDTFNTPSCPNNLPLSCRNSTDVQDLCCFEYPGGVILQTQFWDYRPPKGVSNNDDLEKYMGPLNSFTNHGLWPDNCDGTYEQFCDDTMKVDDVYSILNSSQFNRDEMDIKGRELLTLMEKYWKSNNGNDESLWIHEFNKHGTCFSTLKSECYDLWDGYNAFSYDYPDTSKRAVYDYFRVSMERYQQLNTSYFLESQGITPSINVTYTKEEIENALKIGFDEKEVYFKCDQNGALVEVWYFHILKGSVLEGKFHPIDSLQKRSNCPIKGIKWYPKGYRPHIPPTPPKKKSKGTISLVGLDGFIIKNGHWYFDDNAIPAKFFLSESPFGNYYLKSKMGYCGIEHSKSGLLSCNRNISTASQFEYDENNHFIGYSGVYNWSAKYHPKNREQTPIYITTTSMEKYVFQLKFSKSS